jgi:hypothetical protein
MYDNSNFNSTLKSITMKKKPSKLTLDKQTISKLSDADAASANGGMAANSCKYCPSMIIAQCDWTILDTITVTIQS